MLFDCLCFGRDARREATTVADDARAKLAAFTRRNTRPLDCDGRKFYARLVGAYDGDTVTVVAELVPGSVHQLAVRLSGINAPEMGAPDVYDRARAVRARNRLIQFLTSGGVVLDAAADYKRGDIDAALAADTYLVWLECGATEKYGRTLARVFPETDPNCANDLLVSEGLALPM